MPKKITIKPTKSGRSISGNISTTRAIVKAAMNNNKVVSGGIKK